MRSRLWFPIVFSLTLAFRPAAGWAEALPGPAPRSFFLFGPSAAQPQPSRPPSTPVPVFAAAAPAGGEVCRAAGRIAGRAAAVPDHLMAAIARVESGRPDGLGNTAPWPWSINVEGVDHVFDSKAQAVAAVRALQARGVQSIDVGCMQVNLAYHPGAFVSLEQAFDPFANATYAAHFLIQLRDQTGSWDRAVAAYHSATPELGEPYRRKVMAALPDEKRIAGVPPLLPGMPPGGGGMPSNNAAHARTIPLAANAPPGRDLMAYRSSPIQITGRRLPWVARGLPGMSDIPAGVRRSDG